MTTTVQFLNGLDTIGGNVVSFTTDKARVIMDFGINFAPADTTPADLVASGILPDLPDLFTDAPSDGRATAIFVSHLHLDHMGALQYLTKPTDVYMSLESVQLYEALVAKNLEMAPNAVLHVISPEEPVIIGDLTVRAFLTDHDIMGALMLEVTDGKHRFVHSGDVRYDGLHPERVQAWTTYLHDHQPDLFMLEGTEFSFEQAGDRERHTEMDLQARFADVLQGDELVVINPYERNVERLASLMQTAQQAGRQIVWDDRFASILQALRVPDVLELGVDVDLDTIKANPSKYVLQNHFYQLPRLNSLPTFRYLHMNGEPLGDYDPRYADLVSYLTDRGIDLELMGASGHATPADLLQIAAEVAAKVTVPWHSFKPEVEAEAIRRLGLETYLPSKGERLVFD